MRMANTDIKRTRYFGAKYFSKPDVNEAYHQLEIEPESRGITVFSTYIGLYRYTHPNYGTTTVAEIFQHTLQKCLQGIRDGKQLADHIILFGYTREEHSCELKK